MTNAVMSMSASIASIPMPSYDKMCNTFCSVITFFSVDLYVLYSNLVHEGGHSFFCCGGGLRVPLCNNAAKSRLLLVNRETYFAQIARVPTFSLVQYFE